MDKIFSPIKGRIIDYLENRGFQKEKFFEKTAISASNFKGKGAESELGGDKIVKILTEFPEINPEWLLTGSGGMLRDKSSSAATVFTPDGVPLISQEAAAGFGSLTFCIGDEDVQARYVVPDFNGIDFMIRVKGSSMYPKYSSGDIVACRVLQESKFIQWNKTYVIATREQGLLCKRLRKSENKGCLLAVSDNKEYDPFDLPEDEITGIALVVGVIRLE